MHEAVTDELPDDDLRLAWKKLYTKFEPKTTSRLTDLKFEFSPSELDDIERDPKEWIN